jgi:hypothetical protein
MVQKRDIFCGSHRSEVEVNISSTTLSLVGLTEKVRKTSVLCHIGHTFLREGEVGMVSKQMKKLDKNHFEIIHLGTWKTADMIIFHPKEGTWTTNSVALYDMLKKQTPLPGECEYLLKGS